MLGKNAAQVRSGLIQIAGAENGVAGSRSRVSDHKATPCLSFDCGGRGRAPALPAFEAGKGRQKEAACKKGATEPKILEDAGGL